MKEKYPQLAKYLHSAKTADRIYAAKRPGPWVKWGLFVVTMVVFDQGNHTGAFAILALLTVVDFLFIWFRLKPDSLADFVRKGLEEKMPTVVKRHFDKGDLDVIGSEAMAALERCAAAFNEVVQVYVYHGLLGARLSKELKKALQKELNGADVVMRAALKTLYRPITMRAPASQDEVQAVHRLEATLVEICHNAGQMLPANEPPLDTAAEAEIARIEATRELRQENKG